MMKTSSLHLNGRGCQSMAPNSWLQVEHPSLFSRIILLILVCLWSLPSPGQMVSPAMDRPDEPFSYFSKPTDVIGVMDGKEGTLVSPEGYLYTGWGELMFFTGNPPEPVNQRVKTLFKGYLPVIEYRCTRGEIRYEVTAFAATLDGRPESPLVNFVRVNVSNTSRLRRTAFFSAAVRYQGEVNTTWGAADNRFTRPAKANVLGQYEQAGAEFSRDWVYGFEKDAVLRDSSVVYLYTVEPEPARLMTWKTAYNGTQDTNLRKLNIQPATPAGIVQYALTLEPGASRALEFKMPYEPMSRHDPALGALRSAGFDAYLQSTVSFWEGIFSRGIDIQVPEEKVVNTFKANLVYDLIARNKQEGWYIQKVNEFHYDAFWLRDASYIVRMYDVSGYHDIARQCLAFFGRWQQPDGNFVSQGGQFDGWGQTLWAYGQHFRLTRDRDFAAEVFPSIQKAVAWLKQARRDDPLHLMPSTTPGDNESITGHVTGHNFAALGGLKNAIALAEGLGKSSDAGTFKAEYDDYLSALRTTLSEVTGKTGGYIPPGLDRAGGQDWGNMESVYPEMVLEPSDPMVGATLKATRAKYQEGIMTYGDGFFLHHYLTISNTETEVIRGEQQTAIDELYALLVHTSATHAGFEFAIRPWGTRDFGMNLSPHGWFAAKYRTLLRDMMVREQGNDLHLFSCLSPAWIKGDISVHRAPTNFGIIDADLACSARRGTLVLKTEFRSAPEAIVLHLPWFLNVKTVVADGKPMGVRDGEVRLPADTKRVEMTWTPRPDIPASSYERAVNLYKQEYRMRYERFLTDGK